jgi:hypothetical protein
MAGGGFRPTAARPAAGEAIHGKGFVASSFYILSNKGGIRLPVSGVRIRINNSGSRVPDSKGFEGVEEKILIATLLQ